MVQEVVNTVQEVKEKISEAVESVGQKLVKNEEKGKGCGCT